MSERLSDGVLELSLDEWLVPFLLVGLRERSSQEGELIGKVVGLGFEVTHPGAYLALRQMEEEGLLVSERDEFNGGSRMYSILESGEAYLELWASSLAWHQEEVDLFMKLYARTGHDHDKKPLQVGIKS